MDDFDCINFEGIISSSKNLVKKMNMLKVSDTKLDYKSKNNTFVN